MHLSIFRRPKQVEIALTWSQMNRLIHYGGSRREIQSNSLHEGIYPFLMLIYSEQNNFSTTLKQLWKRLCCFQEKFVSETRYTE